MTDQTSRHESFTIERELAFAPGVVFEAWATPQAKARWFYGPPGQWTLQERSLDFRVGGREHLRGEMAGGPVSRFDALYYDIVAGERIVYSYEMHLDATRISVSLATIELAAIGRGPKPVTRMRFTEQAVFLDAWDDAGSRQRGTSALLDQFAASLLSR